MDMAGDVFEIQHFSLHDGPGIRSVVFLKGCPLRCLWCHNPEGRSIRSTPMLETRQCEYCGACAAVCEAGCHSICGDKHLFDALHCAHCGKCIEKCPTRAMHWVDRQMTVREVLEDVLRDLDYFSESGGGITLSGGEPMQQPDFAYALLREAGRAGMHRAIETCGYAKWEIFDRVRYETDLFLFDIKETDPLNHKRLTGVNSDIILHNLKNLYAAGASIVLRCPIVPGCNDRDDHIRAVGELYQSMPGLLGVELLPYHSLGLAKAEKIGMSQSGFGKLDPERLREWNAMLCNMGIHLWNDANQKGTDQ